MERRPNFLLFFKVHLNREVACSKERRLHSVFHSQSPVVEIVSPGMSKEEVFVSPPQDTREKSFYLPGRYSPVEIKVHVPEGDQPKSKIQEILDELIESERSYVDSFRHIPVCIHKYYNILSILEQ